MDPLNAGVINQNNDPFVKNPVDKHEGCCIFYVQKINLYCVRKILNVI